MNQIKKICFSLLAALLVFSNFSGFAQAEISEVSNGKSAIVSNEDTNEVISMYKEPSEESEILIEIPADSEVSLLPDTKEDSTYSLVVYSSDELKEDLKGYVLSKFVTTQEVPEVSETNQDNGTQEKLNNDEKTQTEAGSTLEETVDQNEGANNDDTIRADEETEIVESSDEKSVQEPLMKKSTKDVEQAEVKEEVPLKQPKSFSTFSKASLQVSSESYNGIALKSPTHVYKELSTSSQKLKSYEQGSILKYKALNSQWFIATVYVNGKASTGYISKNDVENVITDQTNVKGAGVQSPTNIYSQASEHSSVIKTYSIGSILYYKTFTSGWYECLVYVNGSARTGYIKAADVTKVVSEQVPLKGVAIDTTSIYNGPSTSSSVLKSYSSGTILVYKTFINGWYECTVYINGQPTTGYIKTGDVTNVDGTQKTLKGVATLSSTPIYSGVSTNTSILKSYSAGSILVYKTFIDGWYECTVYINGHRRTGYIHASDVENSVNDQKQLRGIGLQTPTKVFSKANTSSAVLKSYPEGTVLYYTSFIGGWYEAIVYVNGHRTSGYIDASHVENILDKQDSLQGLSLKSPTDIYSKASKSSNIIKDYPKGTVLKYKTFSSNWYEATVYISGEPTVSYINKDDVKTMGTDVIQDFTDYGMTLDEMLARQMNNSPQTDKYRNEAAYIYADYVNMNKGIVTDRVNVRSSPNTNSSANIVQTLNKNDGVYVIGKQGDWVEVRVTWKNANAEDVITYLDPENFTFGSKEYYQFLKLSLPANLSVSEINQKVLEGKGILDSKGQAFVDAANKYKVNEVYLISHALLETGNGTSNLAKGTLYNGVVVYNMYGYGAFDQCALECGAKTAYEQGWFTPEDAIIGGAQLISQGYIYRDGFQQDTLYKMRWNPESTHQYATDIGWAYKQVNSIFNIYELLDNYTLYFDKPLYGAK
ncbi:hypothetical protein FGG79_18290 [Bacillus sp. BHET2]|uniref:N-acetylglucosaminidase n=1 Tax=Bacillus sp. BHET2 TaxID=2583818 RepID=UPI00110E5631|nr:N-acetylglucosaminidase [Bacillus sp. BHET2]TMU84085.1 hypothetical protein FGG79_18290 [Bacillus sp. BHET2]